MLCHWGIVPFVTVASSNSSHKHSHGESSGNTGKAIEILKERYAKGEITKETYFEMREDIKS